ncbi:putative two-component system sensor kinase [Gordonia spumicola]|uniref:Putative two-component system sensor kinase n=1 Tax=Gordonia spumicola TaxID=589161 RepID=A0A7I9VA16_9ACTN|nr:ATP-binding protein [Gordonia spumicola]GEE01923.1 putative two-component system sensor kinase [Gordonia spumicola]
MRSELRTVTTAPRLHRRSGGKVIAGVCGGIADHLGVSVFRVRVIFVVLAALAGAGVVAYGLLWFFCPAGDDTAAVTPAERRQAYGLAVIGVIALAANGMVATSAPAQSMLAILFVLGGAAIVWREADVTGVSTHQSSRTITWMRMATGAAFVIGGLVVMVTAPDTALAGMPPIVIAVLATLVGAVLLTVPVWMRMLRALNEERSARIRNDEREEIASHLHDSVLQTLALIQKQAAQPETVARLARSQERELRQWLFGDSARPRESLAAAISAVAAEVEDAYGVEIEAITVGDVTPEEMLDPARTRAWSALVSAAREAMVNASKHSGADTVDVYCEVADDQVDVFVRDRGAGFDVDAVDADRQGVSRSIRGRMERAGGTARVTSTVGRGTNVALTLPRAATPDQTDQEIA